MKKLWILLVALTVLAAMPIFASDVTISGDFRSFANYDFANPELSKADISRERYQLSFAVDDYISLLLAFQGEGSHYGSVVDGAVEAADASSVDFYTRYAKLDADFGAALGLPVTLTGTFGYFETYMTGWYYWDTAGYAWYYDWPNSIPGAYQTGFGAMQLNVGYGPVNLHYYTAPASDEFLVGADLSVFGVSLFLGYGATYWIPAGDLSVEAKYDLAFGDVTGGVSAFFRYALGAGSAISDNVAKDYAYGANLGVNYGMFGVAAGFTGNNDNAFDNLIVEAAVMPLDPAKIAVAFLMEDGAFTGVDISASYAVGAAKFSAGYVIGDPMRVVPSMDNYTASGLYGGVTLKF
jgi:hypothetical protein